MRLASLICCGYLLINIGLGWLVGRFFGFADLPPTKAPRQERRARVPRYAAGLALVCLLLAACGGGGTDAIVSAATGLPVISSVGNNGQNGPGTGGPRCASQGYPGTFPDCQCPEPWQTYTGATQTVAGTCTGTPPPSCPTGQSLTGYGAQCCPTGDTGNGTTCTAPPPATCPVNTYGTPPNCLPIPSCSAVVGGYWGGPQAGCVCPAQDTGTYPNCQPPATCPAGYEGIYPNCTPPTSCPGGYWGGQQCECPAGEVGAYPACVTQSSITLTVTANVDPATVVDTTGTSTLSFSVVSSLPSDNVLCVVNGQGDPVQPGNVSIGPFAPSQDGSAVDYTVTCTDTWNVTAVSQTVSVAIVAPPAAPPDTFACAANGDGTYSCSWYTYEPGAECYVIEYSSSGPESAGVQLIPGGTPSGAVGSVGNINAAYGPWNFTLSCNTGTTASPNPIEVTP